MVNVPATERNDGDKTLVDPGIEESGGTFLVSTGSGTAPVAELISDGKRRDHKRD
jgi:hypothetical protein